ncbi:MAG: hypothetical protein KC729_09270 [Candidatus Eisenbacteria bacterium]|uniref:Uncharacterized protein n=1 Tax=Eiseniibacteriota bacterium TaxID=2212470 RepID=A0A956RQP8_UNCEI|nr:hypothetical protein [Candidatus Eisenbacteria bacterium]
MPNDPNLPPGRQPDPRPSAPSGATSGPDVEPTWGDGSTPRPSISLVAIAHPLHDRLELHLHAGPRDQVAIGDVVEIADADGAPIWFYRVGADDFPNPCITWDGRTTNGGRAASGIFWIRVARDEITLAATCLHHAGARTES